MNIKFVTLFMILLSSKLLYAHGMNKHGPNGGYINMPGDFHTELVDSQETMKVYLLDIRFNNPEVVNSSVKIKYTGSKSESEYICIKNTNYFECKKPSAGLANIKEVRILAVRNNSKGREAVYKIPLKLEGE